MLRKNILGVCLALFLALPVVAQTKPIRIVFDITSQDTLTHQAVMRHVSGMASAYPGIQLEVVVYGGALPMLLKNQSTVFSDLQKLAGNGNVSFKVCEATMKRYQVDKSQLISGVNTVPDAIIEIVTRQSEGWGYIKESHN